jgi:hypothetical protein
MSLYQDEPDKDKLDPAKTQPNTLERALVVYEMIMERLKEWAQSAEDDSARDDIMVKVDKFEKTMEEISDSIEAETVDEKKAYDLVTNVAENAEKELTRVLATKGVILDGLSADERPGIGFLQLLMQVAGPLLKGLASKKMGRKPKAAAPPPPPPPPPKPKTNYVLFGVIGAAVLIPVVIVLLTSGGGGGDRSDRRGRR